MSRLGNSPNAAADGDFQAAGELIPLIYDELRRLARARLARLPSGQRLTPSELVHEAYLRVVRRKSAGFEGPGHLFFAVSRAMQDITVETARSTACLKRGGDAQRMDFHDVHLACQPPPEDFLDLERALNKLRREDPVRARVVLLRYFEGLTHPEIAKTMGLSLATVERKWSRARSWLHRELSRSAPEVGLRSETPLPDGP